MIMETKDRIEKAVELFKSGYNCSQSVVGAFADMYGFTEEQAFRMSASFGGGIGRMRQTCGDWKKELWKARTVKVRRQTMRWCRSWLLNSRNEMAL